jgi:hypothetical protein
MLFQIEHQARKEIDLSYNNESANERLGDLDTQIVFIKVLC